MTFIGVKRKTKTWEHVLSTILIYVSAAGIAIIFPDVIAAFSFIGGTGCVFIVFLFPMWIYVKTNKEKWYSCKNLFVTLLNVILSGLGITAATLSLLEAMDVIDLS